jgi:hypothetical protein
MKGRTGDTMKPRMMQADQAADLLGIHVFQLARALRN